MNNYGCNSLVILRVVFSIIDVKIDVYLNKEQPPECIPSNCKFPLRHVLVVPPNCNFPLRHVLIDCVEVTDFRHKIHDKVNSLSDLFTNVRNKNNFLIKTMLISFFPQVVCRSRRNIQKNLK